MAETFQVVGGAMACVDLAMKAYKEIERFRLRVKQADEVGEELASKYGRLTKTLDDVHSALRCRKEQLHGQTPSEGEARVWVNIHDSLIGMRKAMRTFKKELEILDQGRDVTKKRKWIDRAIWQMKLNKKAPVFDKLEEAANTRIDELTLSLFSMQIFMHTETNSYIQVLVDRMDSIEASLRKVSTTVMKSPAIGTNASRKTNKKQLQVCLQVAHAIVDRRKGTTRVSEQRRDSRVTAMLPEDDGASIWTDAGGESMFEQPATPRRGTLQLAPDELPPLDRETLGLSKTPRTPQLEDFSDSSDDEFDDLSDDDSDDASMTTDMTNMDDINDSRDRFETAPVSLETTISHDSARTGSIASTYSNASCTGIDQRKVDDLMRAIKAKDANKVRNVLNDDPDSDPARRVSITISRIPILHMAVLKEAGPGVIDALFKSSRVDINAVEPEEKKSALHWAVKYNRQSCCARLLQASGVNIEIEDKYQFTPLHSALHLSAHSDADVYTVVKLLLEAGAKIPTSLPRGMSNTVETLVKKHERRRRASNGVSTMGGAELAKARTTEPPERRSSDDASSIKRRFTSLGRSFSAKN